MLVGITGFEEAADTPVYGGWEGAAGRQGGRERREEWNCTLVFESLSFVSFIL